MNDLDNPGNFYSEDDDWSKDDEDSWKPVKINGRALYKKSKEILNLSIIICDLLDSVEEDGITQKLILENATRIPAKIRGGMAVDDIYSLVMENAVIIKVNICELKAQLWACEELHGIDKKYVGVLREEIENFKTLFVDWVQSFDKTNDLPDEWYLFNDPNSFPEED